MLQGVVVRSTGSWYEVELEDGNRYAARMIGKFRLVDKKVTNPLAVGDHVQIELDKTEEQAAVIKKILPRKNYIVRQSPRKKHNAHLLACNVDQAVLIVTIVEPNLKQGFIDRFLMMTEPYNIPGIIVFNKSDIYEQQDLDIYHFFKKVYEKIGYHVMLASAETGEGVEELKAALKDKVTLVGGQSGVGKSSIINKIDANLDLRTSDISDHSGKGQHTTTFAEMFSLDATTKIIDTPGIKTLAFNHLEVKDVTHNFRELFEISSECKYSNCTHRNEPKCAVKQAIEDGDISEFRYANYLQIIDEIEDQNYWERNTDI